MRQYHERWRGSNLLAMSSESDRRDADLMLRLASRCPSCQFRMWRWFWSDQLDGSVWQRCGYCGNIRCASEP